MDLLPLLHIGIVLSDPLQSELVHEVDGVGCVQVSLLEGGKRGREGGRGGGGGREEGGRGEREGGTEISTNDVIYTVQCAISQDPDQTTSPLLHVLEVPWVW